MDDTRVCTVCGDTVPVQEYCSACIEAFPMRKAPADMTPEEKAREIRTMRVVEVPVRMMHSRIEKLLGRDVWTHEFADFEKLEEEALSQRKATMGDVFGKLAAFGKPVIVVAPPT